ncbi:sigma 54-interacting transcriptional regulator [Petroclostridium sp. X23]|uniref:sigma 54-interacting transcriptional regulator n=1 Tax=Petroclostridium sp. X23 TaxID=3045146 RepID=UPI0024AE2EB9|nr:sigma 54-interacting transcriptional regulator [Petroclostridium sp. X23]WHH60355.1 sigma 54-interacting transcriptional regulator [Petroclostridium sp. X23]
MIKVTFIIPYKEIEAKVKSYLKEVEDEKIIFETAHILGTQETFLKQCSSDIVVARGITYLAFKKNLKNVSVIEIAVTGYDIITAVNECKKKYNTKKVAIIASESIIYEVDSLKEIMGIDIEVFKIKDEEDIEGALKTAQTLRADAIVGGLTTCNMAEEMGWNCIRIKTGEEAIRRSIKEALNAAYATRLERGKAELVNIVLDNAKEAIVAFDQDGIINNFNRAAYRTLNIPLNRKVKGQAIKEIIRDSDLLDVMKTKQEEVGIIRPINGTMVVCNWVPIKVESQNVGFVCTFQNVDKIQDIESKIRKELNNKGLVAKYTFGNIIGNSNALNKAKQIAYKYSQVDSNILLVGETGTGKELFAQSIHNASKRTLQPFVAINCAAVPENLLESELFGYAEGAFSGAAKGGKVGLFELAHRGTIFLDEISELPLNLQAKLLRVLQEREIRRIGDDKVIPIDVRVISASNISLKEKVKNGDFRQDLLYRLDVLNFKIPPLRDREEDIIDIARYYIEKYCKETHKILPVMTKEATDVLKAYSWPGNIRELRNICERLMVLTDTNCIAREDVAELLDVDDAQVQIKQAITDNILEDSDQLIDDEVKELLRLKKVKKRSKEDIAKALGISRTTLWRRLKEKS